MEGFSTYSPQSVKNLWNGENVAYILDFNFDELHKNKDIVEAMHRISVSGAQEKFPAIIDCGKIRISQNSERSTYILKPAPWNQTLQSRKQIPANEHLTMQIASQVYGIVTAANGLCFTQNGQPVYVTKRFDIMPDGTKIAMEDFATLIGNGKNWTSMPS